MKFKFRTDSEAAKRKKLAAQALTEIWALSAAKYPIAMLFDKYSGGIERQAGDSWPQAYGRKIGLDLPQLHDFVRGIFETGLYQSNEENPPTAKELHAYFMGWACVLVEAERELGQRV